MKKLIFSFLTLILLFCSTTFCREKYADYVKVGGKSVKTSSIATYNLMETFPLSTVTVYLTGTTTLANIYSNSSGTVKSNPFTSDSKAYYEFYADNGKYDIKFSGAGITSPFTKSSILLNDVGDSYNPSSFGAACDNSTNDTAAFNSLLAVIGSTKATIEIPQLGPCRLNTITFPENVTLDFHLSGGLYGNNSQNITIVGPLITTGKTQIFYNLLSGQGNLLLTGNKSITKMTPEMFGGKADNSTNNSAQVNTIISVFAAANIFPTVYFPANGNYIASNAPSDTSLSNSQIALPKVPNSSSMLTVTFEGTSIPPTPWNNNSGAIFRSTNTIGTDWNFIGVKSNWGASCSTASCQANNITSNIFLVIKNMTIRMPINTTGSTIDASRMRNLVITNSRIDTDDFGIGGLNPHFLTGTNIPSPICTQFTTTTSYALKLPIDILPNSNIIDGLFTAGYYNHIRTGELTKARNIVMHCGKNGFVVDGSTWPGRFDNITIAAVSTPIKPIGTTPDLIGFSGSNTNSSITFTNVGVENDSEVAWTPVIYVVDDPNQYLRGSLQIFYGAGLPLPTNPAYLPKFPITRSERPYNTRDPSTDFTGFGAPSTEAFNWAIDETKSGIQTSDESGLAWKVVTCNLTGTANGCGIFAVANDAIANGSDKRLGFIYIKTVGAINNGQFDLFLMSAGVSNRVATFDRTGNIISYGSGGGLILKSPDTLTCKKISIDNAGTLITVTVTCP